MIKNYSMKISELLKTDSKYSSMRYALLYVIWMSLILIICTGFYIVYSAAKCIDIDWGGIAMLIGSISLFIGTIATGKVLQKKQELKK